MKAIGEPLPPHSQLVRIGEDDWNDDGPYDLSIVITPMSFNQTVMVRGLDKPILPSHWRAVKEWVITNFPSARELVFTRKLNGEEIYRSLPIYRSKNDAKSQ